jgi:MoaA/NifB/PqqE/SkfB family radical SAM enzyme
MPGDKEHPVNNSSPGTMRRFLPMDRRMAAGMTRAVLTAARNLIGHHVFGESGARPLYAVWYVTLRCNLACEFCDDGFGRKYPEVRYPELKTGEALRLLELIREGCSSIYFTGGEPFVRKDFHILLRRSRELGFWPIFVNSNLSLRVLPEDALRDTDVLIISLGSTDQAQYDQVLHGRPGQTGIILENLKRCARWEAEGGPRIVVNCVISAHRIADARSVFAFCREHDLYFSPVAEHRGVYADARLLADLEYHELREEVLAAKKSGHRVYGSLRGLEILLRARPFHCYPALAPHIYPNGDLLYPCHPLRQRTVNLLQHGSFREIWQQCCAEYSGTPRCDNRCHLACYVNNSQWMEHPIEMVIENFRVTRLSP